MFYPPNAGHLTALAAGRARRIDTPLPEEDPTATGAAMLRRKSHEIIEARERADATRARERTQARQGAAILTLNPKGVLK